MQTSRPDITSSYRLQFLREEPSGLFIENNGVGPGTILSLKVKFKDKILEDCSFLEETCGAEGLTRFDLRTAFVSPGNTISAGKEIGIIAFHPTNFPRDQSGRKDLAMKVHAFRVIVKYKD